MVFTMANVGLPGTSGFVGEFLTLARRLPGQHLGRVLRHHRRHPVGRLRALALPPRDLRRAREAEPARASPTSTGARSRILAPLVVLVIYYGVMPGRSSTASRASTDALDQGLPGRAVADEDCGAAACTEVCDEPGRSPSPPSARPLPEIILAVGALVLVLSAPIRGERLGRLVNHPARWRSLPSRSSPCWSLPGRRASRPSTAPSSSTRSPAS